MTESENDAHTIKTINMATRKGAYDNVSRIKKAIIKECLDYFKKDGDFKADLDQKEFDKIRTMISLMKHFIPASQNIKSKITGMDQSEMESVIAEIREDLR